MTQPQGRPGRLHQVAATQRSSSFRDGWVALVIVAVAMGGALALVGWYPRWQEGRVERARRLARQKMEHALVTLRKEKLERRGRINTKVDPTSCGAIGALVSPITSKVGLLSAKQSTCNPHFASVMVDLLREAGLRRGDRVAVALSGSFPALNIATIIAAETLGLKPVIVSSLSASMFGANTPDLTWLDMESALAQAGVIHTRSVAATLGGKNDNGVGLSAQGRALLRKAAHRNGIPLLHTKSLHDAIHARLRLYSERAGGRGVKAYVNVGGARASVGSSRTKASFKPGLNTEPPRRIDQPGVMSIMSRRGLPVIHLGNIRKLCAEHGLSYGVQAEIS